MRSNSACGRGLANRSRNTICAIDVGDKQENVMRFIEAISLLVLIWMVPASAAELPSRKPGLWQVKTSIEGGNAPARVIQQCIDAATDQMMQSSAGPFAPEACPERNVTRSENSMTIDSIC